MPIPYDKSKCLCFWEAQAFARIRPLLEKGKTFTDRMRNINTSTARVIDAGRNDALVSAYGSSVDNPFDGFAARLWTEVFAEARVYDENPYKYNPYK